MSRNLNQQKALIFRITHRANLPWILENGIHCANAGVLDPNFVPIGNADLIGRRRYRQLPQPYEGTLSDHVPFYFTPFSPMLLNIVTGYNGVPRQEKRDILILVSSIWKLQEHHIPFVFSDRHAYLQTARFSHDPEHLGWIPWQQLQARDFKRDPNDPEKVERYEAEALARAHVPTAALVGTYCYNDVVAREISDIILNAGSAMRVIANAGMYF